MIVLIISLNESSLEFFVFKTIQSLTMKPSTKLRSVSWKTVYTVDEKFEIYLFALSCPSLLSFFLKPRISKNATYFKSDHLLYNINENLEQQAQAIFRSWFVDFEPFGGVMPDDWKECTLNSICDLIIKGITPKYTENSDQLVINQKCVRNHQIDLSLARPHTPKKVNEKWLKYGDVLVNSTGTGTLGRAAQVQFIPNNLTVDSHVSIIRASKQEYVYFLGLWATSHEHDFEMLQTGSTGQTDLPRERLKQMQIILPSESILSSFSDVIKPIADIRIQKQQESQRLSLLRDTLLPKLMNGEIDVSQVRI